MKLAKPSFNVPSLLVHRKYSKYEAVAFVVVTATRYMAVKGTRLYG